MAPQYDAIVVGAGFGGMGAAIELKRLGLHDLLILEREDDLGGTWHVNRYPGLAVDIPSSTYSYSFEPNPHWSRLFAPGEELKRYAEHVAVKYGLRPLMRFGVTVTGARWRDGHWEVVAGEKTFTARYLVTATGFLSMPKMPDIEGIESFQGKVIHTAAWEPCDLAGKRVAIIGTGATAVQLIPELARQASALTVYQRTPIWVSPKPDYPIPPAVRTLFARLPFAQRAVRWLGSSVLELMMISGVVRYKQLRVVNRLAERWCRLHLHRQVRDPELRRRLTPDYSFGCKRPTFSNDYFRTFTRPHVRLETASIERVDASGVVTAEGKAEIDVLVLATGFDLWDTNFPAFEVIGREGRDLGAWWRQNRFQAYEGVTVPGFPNYLSLNSPYSYSGLSYFTTIECQMTHVRRLFTAMRSRGSSVFEVTQRANDEFLHRMRTKVTRNSVFSLGHCATAHSYYFNQHGEATLLRPTSTVSAHRAANSFPLSDYDFSSIGVTRTGRADAPAGRQGQSTAPRPAGNPAW
ncbi:NAD(P)/FAD-dependent oxidoreductase [Lentzea sp. BCCO 10_0798]|uniref:NAD(P)/FAD-dependent oxidoreductase n=1 Tax=Lentzea kristufekii TaxID=3095430 RepID=A0ABU4TX58_9PSEU|nr:NAD(P)/FAD-dependent oxidoreductase [Lentzea sp. BCCO 10_0798]MDX8052770.1 NAD(P)/FAD-dependent oxidoreductase [Lentzea sp. BCCO 10_0798]